MLSDIEMPRMDGFDLVRNVRADARLAGLPVVMITSRIAQKHRDYAAELGVDHYLGKPYRKTNCCNWWRATPAQPSVAPDRGALPRWGSPGAPGARRCAKAALFWCQVILNCCRKSSQGTDSPTAAEAQCPKSSTISPN
jgi:hypothetical protein